MPLIKPPYATLTAIDLNKGDIAWQKPVGEGSPAIRNHPLLKDVALPDRLGSDSKGGAIVTAGGLVFVGGGDSYLYAFDKIAGREVWRGAVAVCQRRDADDLSHPSRASSSSSSPPAPAARTPWSRSAWERISGVRLLNQYHLKAR